MHNSIKCGGVALDVDWVLISTGRICAAKALANAGATASEPADAAISRKAMRWAWLGSSLVNRMLHQITKKVHEPRHGHGIQRTASWRDRQDALLLPAGIAVRGWS